MSGRPLHGDLADGRGAAETEVKRRFIAGKKPGIRLQQADVAVGRGGDDDGGTGGGALVATVQTHAQPVTTLLIDREVLVERKIFGQVADEQLDVTVAIEIAGGGAVAHAIFG